MLYKLFSAPHRCAPCKMLGRYLDLKFPEWKNYIEYVDVDGEMTKDQLEVIRKLGIRSLPSISTNEEIVCKGYDSFCIDEIKELCLTKE